jgi:hypothetical protein
MVFYIYFLIVIKREFYQLIYFINIFDNGKKKNQCKKYIFFIKITNKRKCYQN